MMTQRHNGSLYSKTLLGFYLLSLLIGLSQAAWDDPPLELPPNSPPDQLEIVIHPVTGRIAIRVEENLEVLPLARLKFTVPSDQVSASITSSGDPEDRIELSLVQDDATGTEVWELRATANFDYEVHFSPMEIIIDADGILKLVNIEVVDVNDNDPEIISRDPPQIPPIKESQGPPDPTNRIFQINAIDKDTADILTFTLLENNQQSEYFRIDDSTGEVFQLKELDYAVQSSHRLEITVTDGRPPFRNANDAITISVEDIPNRPPAFLRTPIISAFDEELAVDHQIYEVAARDGDTGLDWRIIYLLEDEFQFLKIDENTGEIKINRKMDAESAELKDKQLSYQINITAQEVPPPGFEGQEEEVTETVDITISDINDESPMLCTGAALDCEADKSFSFQISEDHDGQIPMNNQDVILVIDKDYTTRFNSYDVDFATGTDDFIKRAFIISPRQGSESQEFMISAGDIDFEEEEHWHDGTGQPIPVTFVIEFTEQANLSHKAIATFEATVVDVNDNAPKFELAEYEFSICENTEDGVSLWHIKPTDPLYPNSCWEHDEEFEIKVFAEDKDVSSDAFGQNSVIYQWSTQLRAPPITLGAKNGTMTMQLETEAGFDFERRQEEFFLVQAFDTNGAEGNRSDSAYIRFRILDRNDVNVDLKFGQGFRQTINESTPMTGPVLDDIIATDVDQTANVTIRMRLSEAIDYPEALKERMREWFVLEVYEGSGTGEAKARIMLTDTLPDREGHGIMDVDRVDLTIEAEDLNSETGVPQITAQDVTILISDINDNVPEWPSDEEDFTDKTFSVQETDEVADNDTASQREIQRFRVVDKDLGARFQFSLANQLDADDPDCELADNICQDILDIFEFTSANEISGTAVLSRKENRPIDRENRTMFPNLDNERDSIIKLTFIASDGVHSLVAKFNILITDINDNTPQFSKEYDKETYAIPEDAGSGVHIETILATDEDHEDRYGKVSYLLEAYPQGGENDGYGKFSINLENGILTSTDFKYDWFEVQEYQLQIRAIDDYKESIPDRGSLSKDIVIRIGISDKNNHAPNFITKEEEGSPLIQRGETAVEPDVPFDEIIRIQDKDDPSKDNGKFSVEIESVIKTPKFEDDPEDLESFFDLIVPDEGDSNNIKEVKIVPKRDFTGLWGNYKIKLVASDGAGSDPEQRKDDATFTVAILNENLNAPVFRVPEVDNSITYRLSILDAEVDQQLIDITTSTPIPNVHAIDKDKGSGPNGEVTYALVTFEPDPEDPEDRRTDCTDLFKIVDEGDGESDSDFTGKIMLSQKLDPEHKGRYCMLNITASDKGEPVAHTVVNHLQFYLAWHENTPPAFPQRTMSIEMKENQTVTPIVELENSYATDEDIENELDEFNDDIYYYFKGGDYSYFDLDMNRTENEKGTPRRIPIIKPNVLLDREERDSYKIVLYATNDANDPIAELTPEEAERQESNQWLVITVNVLDEKDTAPIFEVEDGMVTGGFSEISRIDDRIRLIVIKDPDLEDPLDITISSSINASDPSLPLNPAPFELDYPDDRSVGILLKFDPKPTYVGYYTFRLTVIDSVGMRDDVMCRMYMVTRQNVVSFYFYNDWKNIDERQDNLTEILSAGFSQRCNIDRIIPDPNLSGRSFGTRQSNTISRVETHFVNLANNEPISGTVIVAQSYVPDVMTPLLNKLLENNFTLADERAIVGPEVPRSENDPKDIIMYALIGGVAVLVVTLLVLGASCYYSNKSLNRRVRALTASTFGSQQSDLNRIGAMNAPNTNSYAVEGSNPIWTVDGDQHKSPQFDTESIGSGGSILIGVEDEDYFKRSAKNPMFLQEDVVANYDSDEGKKGHYYNENYSLGSNGKGPAPQPPPFGAKVSKNPLMNLGGGGRNSIDVDSIIEEVDEEDDFGYEKDDDFPTNDNFIMKDNFAKDDNFPTNDNFIMKDNFGKNDNFLF